MAEAERVVGEAVDVLPIAAVFVLFLGVRP
jgi:hypothetical protein